MLEAVLAVMGALMVGLVFAQRVEFGIANQFVRLTTTMVLALWVPKIVSEIVAFVRDGLAHNPLRGGASWDRAAKLAETDGVTSVLVGSSRRPRNWVLLRFAERDQVTRFLRDKVEPSEAELPNGENARLRRLCEVFRVLATLAIGGYLVNILYFESSMKPHFGISALFLAGFVLVLTLQRFAQKSVSPAFYRAIVETITEEQAVADTRGRLPSRTDGESYRAWLSRLSKMLEEGRDSAYRGAAALHTSDLEATAEHGTEDERLAAAWLLRKVRVAADDDPTTMPLMQRIALAETAEEAELAMLEIAPGALRRRS